MLKIKSILTHVAPTLASALGGPFAGVAVKYIADKLGVENVSPGPELASILEKLLQDSGNLQKVSDIDKDFQLEMQKLNVDVYQLEVEDRKGARQLAGMDMRPHVVLSVAFIVAYFVMLGVIFWAEISPDFNPGMAFQPQVRDIDGKIVREEEWVPQAESLIDLFKILLGVLTAGVGQILNFWFGGRALAKSQPPDS